MVFFLWSGFGIEGNKETVGSVAGLLAMVPFSVGLTVGVAPFDGFMCFVICRPLVRVCLGLPVGPDKFPVAQKQKNTA